MPDSTAAGSLALEIQGLAAYLQRCRWFGSKSRPIARVAVRAQIDFGHGFSVLLAEVSYSSGAPEIYQIPLWRCPADEAAAVLAQNPRALIADEGGTVLLDALFSPDFRAALWGKITGSNAPAPESRVLSVEQSNSSLLYGDSVFVKMFRRVENGLNPDAEILRFLSEERGFLHVPTYVGALQWPAHSDSGALLAIAISAVENRGDAWSFALGALEGFYASLDETTPEDETTLWARVGEDFLNRIAQLGVRTGQLHAALAEPTRNPDFAFEPLSGEDFQTLSRNVLGLWEEVLDTLSPQHVAHVEALTGQVRQRARELVERPICAAKTRTHGDFHLGQVLDTGSDFVILDFEGEPARSLAERRRKQSPVRDVAGMLRSLHYAAHAALPAEAAGYLPRWADAWTHLSARTFLEAWKQTTTGACFRPESEADLEFLLNGFLLEKAIYEVRYELNNRPGWLHIPLSGLARVLRRG